MKTVSSKERHLYHKFQTPRPIIPNNHTRKNLCVQNSTEISVLTSVFLNDIEVGVLDTYHHLSQRQCCPERVLSCENLFFSSDKEFWFGIGN